MLKKFISLLFASVLFASCPTRGAEVKTKVTTGGASASDIVSYSGPKARIAVGSFEVKAGKAYGRIGDGMQEMLIDSLFKTNRFIVLEKAAVEELKGEYELGESGWAADAPEKGTFETADILLTGAITAFEPDYQGKGGGGIVIPIPLKIGGGLKIEKKEAYIAASIRLVDVRTRRIIKTGTVEGYSSKSSLGVIGGGLIGGVALGAGFESYQNTPMEKAVMVMLDNAIGEIVSSVPADYYRYTSEGKPSTVQPTSGEKKGLGIIGGQDTFAPGQNSIFSEDFNKYDVGAIPEGWIIADTSVEVALYEGKKWLRFLKMGRVQRKIKVSGDYSVELTFFAPDPQTSLPFKYANLPETVIENGSIRIAGNLIPGINMEEGVHHLAFSKKGDRAVIFLDGKRIYIADTESAFSENFIITAKGIDINQGKELIVTEMRVSEYK